MKKFLLIIFLSSILFAQPERQIDSLLNSIRNYKPEEMRDIYDKLFTTFERKDNETGKKICDRILNYLAGLEDKSLYIRVYLNSEKFYPLRKKLKIFDHGYEMAKNEGNEDLMGITDMMRGFAYKDNAITDSAMIFALRAKTTFEKTGNNYDLVNVLLIIADLHYWADQLEKAEDIYKEIIVKKGDPYHWNNWRYSVVLDDLGLIKMKQGRYLEAEEYFNKSLNYLYSRGLNYNDSTRMVYIYKMLLEVGLLQKNYKKAEDYFHKALTFAQKFNQSSELPGIYIGKGSLFYEKGKYDSALVYFKKAEKCEFISQDIKSKINLYSGFTKTYSALNNINKAYPYMILLRDAENTADSLFNRTKYMTMYAEYNYANYLEEIDYYKKSNIILILVIVLILFFLSIIVNFYLRLKNANKKIVKKNLEMALNDKERIVPTSVNEQIFINTDNSTDIKGSGLDENIYNDIFNKLESLMINEKLYLSADISLDEIAIRLNTNRAYLSRTINAAYNTNFNNYINTFRIKEAVRFISKGEHIIYNIEGLAQKAGFNNRVSFSKAFYKYTGVTPSFFIRNAKT